MNLAKNQVKKSVDFQSADNGAILKSSIVSILVLIHNYVKTRRAEAFSSSFWILCHCSEAKMKYLPNCKKLSSQDLFKK